MKGEDRGVGVLNCNGALFGMAVVAVSTGILSYLNSCHAESLCLEEGTCLSYGSSDYSCAYVTSGSATSAVYLYVSGNLSLAAAMDGELATLMQGYCAPGEYMQTSVTSEKAACTAYFPYPNALNAAIQDEDGETAHERACGSWIRSGSVPSGSKYMYRSYSSYETWALRIADLEDRATGSVELATRPSAKFRAECARTASAGDLAIYAAGLLAYQHLNAQLENATSLLDGVAVLTAHYCDGPLSAALVLTDDGGFGAVLTDGPVFKKDVLQSALSAVDAPPSAQSAAERVGAALRSALSSATTTVAGLTQAEIEHFYKAASAQSDASPVQKTKDLHQSSVAATFLSLESEAEEQLAYLQGAAAVCAFQLQTQLPVDTDFESNYAAVAKHTRDVHRAHGHSAELGRVHPYAHGGDDAYGERAPPHGPRPGDVARLGNGTVEAASRVGFAQLQTGSDRSVLDSCFSFMRALFADELDEARFESTVPRPLYDRLESAVDTVRQGIETTLGRGGTLEALFFDPSNAIDGVRDSGFRIAGAPRGSWAGLAAPLPEAGLTTEDGVFVMALKQANALFRERVGRVAAEESDACEHPTLAVSYLSSSGWNAYALSTGCTVVLLGMASRPWMDQEYDDASLLSRIGWLVGHELAHVADFSAYALPSVYEPLLSAYPSSTWSEAIADVIAAHAIVATGEVDAETLLAHVCQLWCARTSSSYSPGATDSHPAPNARCDLLQQTLLT